MTDDRGEEQQVNLIKFSDGDASMLVPDVHVDDLDQDRFQYWTFSYGILNVPATMPLDRMWEPLCSKVAEMGPNCCVIVTQKHAIDDPASKYDAINSVVAYAWKGGASDDLTSAMIRGAHGAIKGMVEANVLCASWFNALDGKEEGCPTAIEWEINGYIRPPKPKPLIVEELGNIRPAGNFSTASLKAKKPLIASRQSALEAGWKCSVSASVRWDSVPISIAKVDKDSPLPATAVVFGHASPSQGAETWCRRAQAFWQNLMAQSLYVHRMVRQSREEGEATFDWGVRPFPAAS